MSSEQPSLWEAFAKAELLLAGHAPRTAKVLKEAFAQVPDDLESDMYGRGQVIEQFESKMASWLGKETGVFFPSGTMAQQIALRIWCDGRDLHKVAYHPLCHLEIHEQDGLKKLHRIQPILLGEKDRLITLADIQGLEEDIACLLLELPQREIGGQLPAFEELAAISAYCKERGIKLHLDGARLFEVLPYYEKTAAEVCALFDSVYISFYKGIGGIAGALLAGPEAFAAESKVWKRRHGGDLISLYPYIVSSDYYFEQRAGKMAEYYEGAKDLAALYNACSGVSTLPAVPVSNMFHVHFALPAAQVEPLLVEVTEATGVGFTAYVRDNGAAGCSYEVSIGDRYAAVPKDKLTAAFALLNDKLTAAGV